MKIVPIVWTDESLYDLEVIFDFLAEHSSESAKKVIRAILSRTRQLEAFPQSGQFHETVQKVDEGSFENGEWKVFRHLNGDQTHQGRHVSIQHGNFAIQRVMLYSYK